MRNKPLSKIELENFGYLRDFFRSQIAIWLLILSFVANLVNWVIIWAWIKPVDFPIILHYNVYFGVDLIGDYRQAYILPLIGIILLVVNLLLAIYFYAQKERIASYILMIAALMIQLGLIVGSTGVILINY